MYVVHTRSLSPIRERTSILCWQDFDRFAFHETGYPWVQEYARRFRGGDRGLLRRGGPLMLSDLNETESGE